MRANLSDTKHIPCFVIIRLTLRNLEDGVDPTTQQPTVVRYCRSADQAKRIAEIIMREVSPRCGDHFHAYRAAVVEMPYHRIEPTVDESYHTLE